MNTRSGIVVLSVTILAGLLHSPPELAAQGAALEHGSYQDQVPDVQPPPNVEQDTVLVANFGNDTIRFQYWNPSERRWVTVQIPVRRAVTIFCRECSGQVKLSFDDGQTARSALVNTGAAYAMYWSTATNNWNVGPYMSVQSIIRSPGNH